MPNDESEFRTRQRESQRAIYRALARGSSRADLLELDGVQATIVPAREWFSIFNSVFYDDQASLEREHAVLAAAYERAGVKAWTVWVPPGDEEAGLFLEGRGHALDSTPMLLAASIDSLDLTLSQELDLEPAPTWKMVAEINERAHGILERWTMAAAFETMDDFASRLHVAREDGDRISALIAREHEGDCYFWFVATVPEARGRGIAGDLMRHAMRQARARGCTTTTLESSKMGEPLYTKLGYRPLGRYAMWESRAAGAR